MTREWRDYLADILASALEIEAFVAGMNYDEFFRDRYPDIPWKRMAGMRDKLIHEYAGVDLETVWDVATEELPAIKPLLERLKENLD